MIYSPWMHNYNFDLNLNIFTFSRLSKSISGITGAFILAIIISSTGSIFAQENPIKEDLRESLAFAQYTARIADTTVPAADTLSDFFPPPVEPKLLPDNISFGEKFLWGENGFVRKIGLVPALDPEERMRELHIRRTMLIAHQISGFTTLALMWTAAYFGQRTIDDTKNKSLGSDHQTFVDATIVAYSATGLLAILSPPPLIRRDEGSTTSLHKALAWVHFIGMIVTSILGGMIRNHKVFNMDKAHFHQVAGYITTAALTASMLVITF
ncbi:MAG: hypothetical protein ACYDA4_00150 [Ignavibacteriaceae bacterium]